MSILPLLIVVLIHQNLQLVHSFHNDDPASKELLRPIEDISTIDELGRHIEIVHDSATNSKTDLTTVIREVSLTYIREGLQDLKKLLNDVSTDELVEAYNKLSKEINKCVDEADITINAALIAFDEIEKLFNLVLDDINKIKDSESDESVDQLREHYQLAVNSYLTQFLRELKSDSESVPSSVKKCVESHLILVPLFLKSESQFFELMLYIRNEWLIFVNEKTQLSNEIYEKCSSYLLHGLGRAQDVPTINVQKEKLDKAVSKIMACGIEADKIIDAAYTRLNEILKKSKEVAAESSKKIIVEGGTLNDISNHYVDSVNNFKRLLDSTITAELKEFLAEWQQDSILIPFNVKRCIDDEVEFLRISSLKIEL